MADNDDFYNDPATIGKMSDDVNGQPDDLPPVNDGDPSQSIFTPEKDTTPLDDRGPIDELEASDAADDDQLDELIDAALMDDAPTDRDPDDYNLGYVNPSDEQDGTER